jgi:hypothetical protein
MRDYSFNIYLSLRSLPVILFYMSIRSARNRIEKLVDSTPEGFPLRHNCFPLSLDAIMSGAELPDEYYEMFSTANKQHLQNGDELVSALLRNFFKAEVLPSQNAGVADYNAFGAGAQAYFPDVPYEYELTGCEGTSIDAKCLRLRDLLHTSAERGCNVLFGTRNALGAHVVGLELVDTSPFSYLIRDTANYLAPANQRVYTIDELWIPDENFGQYRDEYAPLPQFNRTDFPHDSSSWELTILPPTPH